MSSDKKTDNRPCWGEWHGKTIVEIANGSADLGWVTWAKGG
jgi:hypothetical protein